MSASTAFRSSARSRSAGRSPAVSSRPGPRFSPAPRSSLRAIRAAHGSRRGVLVASSRCCRAPCVTYCNVWANQSTRRRYARSERGGGVGKEAMAAVQEGRREAWLGLFSRRHAVEDPVGHLPAIVGREALAQFWDAGIAALKSVEFDVTRAWETDAEAMLLATVTVVAANGVRGQLRRHLRLRDRRGWPDRLAPSFLGPAHGRRGLRQLGALPRAKLPPWSCPRT